MTNDKLVPVWIRQYVQAQIAQALAAKERATPGAEVRGRVTVEMSVGQEIRLVLGPGEQGPSVLRPINHRELEGPAAANYLDAYAAVVLKEGAPPSPTAHFTESLSTPDPPNLEAVEEAYQAINRLARFRIGVHDYESCVACLRTNYKLVFGDDSPLTDPQDMIQRLAAEIQNLRRKW